MGIPSNNNRGEIMLYIALPLAITKETLESILVSSGFQVAKVIVFKKPKHKYAKITLKGDAAEEQRALASKLTFDGGKRLRLKPWRGSKKGSNDSCPTGTKPSKNPKDEWKRKRPKQWKGVVKIGSKPDMKSILYRRKLDSYEVPTGFDIPQAGKIIPEAIENKWRKRLQELYGSPGVVDQAEFLKSTKHLQLMHDLLHLEEVMLRIEIREYDQTKVNVAHVEGLHKINVPGLAEKRPSVLRGDTVLARVNGTDRTQYRGYVHFVNLTDVRVSFHPSILKSPPSSKFDIQFTINRNPYRVQHRAVDLCFSSHLMGRMWAPIRENANIGHRIALSRRLPDISLNRQQSEAVKRVMECSGQKQSPLVVIHGPPGTGKTVTAAAAILEVLDNVQDARMLVCTPSNTAADLLCRHLAKKLEPSRMLRLNAHRRNPKEVDNEVLPFCRKDDRGNFMIPELSALEKYQVVVSTCISSHYLYGVGIQLGHFTHIVVDECAQAQASEVLVSLQLALPETTIVLVGDHKQLGPVIRSPLAMEWKFDRSLMEHLVDGRGNINKIELLESYRAHPKILELYSKFFYEGRLVASGPNEITHSLLRFPRLPNPDIPVMFINVEDEEGRDRDSPSWYNEGEIKEVLRVIDSLLNDPNLRVSPEDVGVVTPYRKQVKRLQQRMHASRPKYDGCKVATPELFQGQERKVIIISLVRSRKKNLEHDSKFKLGFCSSPKRVNVAISRARALLVVIGNATLFATSDPLWRKLLEHFRDNNLFENGAPDWGANQPNNNTNA